MPFFWSQMFQNLGERLSCLLMLFWSWTSGQKVTQRHVETGHIFSFGLVHIERSVARYGRHVTQKLFRVGKLSKLAMLEQAQEYDLGCISSRFFASTHCAKRDRKYVGINVLIKRGPQTFTRGVSGQRGQQFAERLVRIWRGSHVKFAIAGMLCATPNR